MVYIMAVHMSGGTGHEHIAEVVWTNPSDGATGNSTKAVMVDWIDNKSGVARVRGAQGDAQVGVVNGTPPYLRTSADGQWTNNLLSLPKY